MSRSIVSFSLALATLVVLGCSHGSFDNPEHVARWANAGSAVGVFVLFYDPISFSDGQSTFMDPACPATTDDGTTVTITGECTDEEGVERFGTATIVRGVGGERTVTLDGYGERSAIGTSRVTGTAVVRETAPNVHEFDADLVQRGGVTTEVHYAGTVEGTYGTATVWNGSGTVERRGTVLPTGTVQVTTTNEVLDDALCIGQASSGTTTIARNGREVVITYDGETDCDADAAAGWTVDGEDRGLIEGIVCSAAFPRAGARGAWLAFVAIAGGLALRRSTRRRTAVG